MGAALARQVTTNKHSAPASDPPSPGPQLAPLVMQHPLPPPLQSPAPQPVTWPAGRAVTPRVSTGRPADGSAAVPMLRAPLSGQQLLAGADRRPLTRVAPAMLAGAVLVTVALIAGLIWLTGRRIELVDPPVASVPAGSVASFAGSMPKKRCRPAGTATPGDCLTEAITPALKTFVTFDPGSGGSGNFRAMIDAANPHDVVTLTGRDDQSEQTLL